MCIEINYLNLPERYQWLIGYLQRYGDLLKRLDQNGKNGYIRYLFRESFRNAIGAVILACNGYPDLSFAHVRAIWEDHVRLRFIEKHGERAVLEFMHYSVEREICYTKASIDQGTKRGEDVGSLERTLARREEQQREICALLESKHAVKGKKCRGLPVGNIREMCDEPDIVEEYNVKYGFYSSFAHPGGVKWGVYPDNESDGFVGSIGPTEFGVVGVFHETMDNLRRVIIWGGHLCGDQDVVRLADSIWAEYEKAEEASGIDAN